MGVAGYYWSASPSKHRPEESYCLVFTASEFIIRSKVRSNGHSIRPVTKVIPQDSENDIVSVEILPAGSPEDDITPYALAQTKPSFMGRSLDDFSEWLLQQTGEESIAAEARIIIEFIVEKDGALSHVKILQSNAPDWVGKVINAVALSPKWEPGKNSRNQPVRTRCVIAAVNH